MKRQFIGFKSQNTPWGVQSGKVMQYRFNGGGGGGATEEEILLGKVQGAITSKLKEMGLESRDAINALVQSATKDLPIEALRNFKPDEIKEDIRTVSAEVAKLAARGMAPITQEQADAFRIKAREWWKENAQEIVKVLQSRSRMEIRMNVRAAEIMTTSNIVTGFDDLADDTIESFKLGDFVDRRYGQQYVQDIANVSVTPIVDEYMVWSEAGDVEGGFATVLEGQLKPLTSGSVVMNETKYTKLAAKYVITEEVEKFKRRFLNIVDQLIKNELNRDYNAVITANMNAAAVAYTGTPLDGKFTNPNIYQAIGAMYTQAAMLNFKPNVVVLDPATAMEARLATNANGTFLYPVVTQNGQSSILGMTLIESTYQTANYATVAERGLYQIEQEPLTIRIGYGVSTTTAVVSGTTVVTAVESDIDYNRSRVIIEMFFRDWLPTPYIGSIVRDNINTVKAALAD